MTALTWSSNSTGSTMTLRGGALNRPEPIGTTSAGSSVSSMRLPVGGALADQPLAELQALRMAARAVIGIGGKQPQARLASASDQIDARRAAR